MIRLIIITAIYPFIAIVQFAFNLITFGWKAAIENAHIDLGYLVAHWLDQFD